MDKKELRAWIEDINEIYRQANGDRDFKDVLLYAFEEVGRCSQLVRLKKFDHVKDTIPSLFKWFCILYDKSGLGYSEVNNILWNKFPGICPYCTKERCGCKRPKKRIKLDNIKNIADSRRDEMPKTLEGWQQLFGKIYPRVPDAQDSEIYTNISHIDEELSELSEVHRKYYIEKNINLIALEIADVFTWIIGLANFFNERESDGYSLEMAVQEKFGDGGCPDCREYRKNNNVVDSCHCCCSILPQYLRLVSDYEPSNPEVEKIVNRNSDVSY